MYMYIYTIMYICIYIYIYMYICMNTLQVGNNAYMQQLCTLHGMLTMSHICNINVQGMWTMSHICDINAHGMWTMSHICDKTYFLNKIKTMNSKAAIFSDYQQNL